VQRQVKKLTQLRFPKTGYGTLPQIVLDRLIFQQITGTAPIGILEESTAGLKIDPGGAGRILVNKTTRSLLQFLAGFGTPAGFGPGNAVATGHSVALNASDKFHDLWRLTGIYLGENH
jgi:hypothetical protein